ncbi:hypothetical protein [Paenibacillus pabuli]|uniref:hypothetical protein n=1 Tax=Paenibacillus pabuli TaxID=1472 RepID=UPI001FFEC1E8|nr:hypothetical protein [Paenibacillus pabuli]UPK42500.1 hypothetical protein KET34_25425 [Paenibacillus pabuli]
MPKHKTDGHYLDQYGQPVEKFTRAIQFFTPDDDYGRWLLGWCGPKNPKDYYPAKIEITKREVEEDGRSGSDEETTRTFPTGGN